MTHLPRNGGYDSFVAILHIILKPRARSRLGILMYTTANIFHGDLNSIRALFGGPLSARRLDKYLRLDGIVQGPVRFVIHTSSPLTSAYYEQV